MCVSNFLSFIPLLFFSPFEISSLILLGELMNWKRQSLRSFTLLGIESKSKVDIIFFWHKRKEEFNYNVMSYTKFAISVLISFVAFVSISKSFGMECPMSIYNLNRTDMRGCQSVVGEDIFFRRKFHYFHIFISFHLI